MMKLELQNACKTVRGLEPPEAADWLIANFSFEAGNAGEAFSVMPHRSWPKSEQIKLANYYLRNLPHSTDRGYKAFLRIMALPTFINVMKRHLPEENERPGLAGYHLRRLLKAHPDYPKYQSVVDEFLDSLS